MYDPLFIVRVALTWNKIFPFNVLIPIVLEENQRYKSRKQATMTKLILYERQLIIDILMMS